jgi:predicted nucleic acid-binding protein
MTGRCFVDANVFIYTRDPRDPRKQSIATNWIAHLWRERLGRTSAQVLSEYYAVATRKLAQRLAPDLAWDYVRELLSWHPLPIDATLLIHAREVEQRYRISWWDGMIVAAAQLQDCSTLLTEDLQDGMMFGSVTVRSPFSADLREPAATYATPSRLASLHRPRGRPRRAAAA